MRVACTLLLTLVVACGVPTETGDSAHDAGGSDAGGSDAGEPDAGTTCTPKSCGELGAECGAPDDGCGNALSCGSCPSGTCGENHTCSCEPESDEAFCATHRATCDSVTNWDNCGEERTVDCGRCPFGECGLEGTPHRCGFVDARDGNTYGFVQIGTQLWMSHNLNYAAPNSYCALGRDPDPNPCPEPKFGRYYTWLVAMQGASSSSALPSGVRGVCPEGWHLPSRGEWDQLAGVVAQAHGVQGDENRWPIARRLQWHGSGSYAWQTPDVQLGGAPTDDHGFSLLPAGVRPQESMVTGRGADSYHWSATADQEEDAFWYTSGNAGDTFDRIANHIYFRASVRCVKD